MSIGDTLAEARRDAGLTMTEVSHQTRIRESIVRAIEQGDFSPCGGDFYARGHIRSIADVVGADPVPLVREYDEEHPPAAMRAAQIFEPATPIRIRERRNLHLGWALLVVLLGAIGFGAYHVLSTHGASPSATPTAAIRPVAKATAPAKPAVHKAVPPNAVPPKNEAVIKLTATTNCWVGFNSPTGQSLYQHTISAGQTMTWNEKSPVSMVIGNPSGVQVTVNGKVQKMNPGAVATLSINPSSKTPVTVG